MMKTSPSEAYGQAMRVIDRYYPADTLRRDIYLRHCCSVAALALEINSRLAEPLDPFNLEAAALLHDIGICLTDAPDLDCHGDAPYIAHGYLGADLLRREGCPEEWARVAERHTGAGLTHDDIVRQHLPLPPGRSYLPVSMLEKLVCYADKFYSKSGDMERKTLERVRRGISRHGADSLARFDRMTRLFNV